jgi:RNA-binding protein YhbY
MSIPNYIRKIASDPSFTATVRVGRGGMGDHIIEELVAQLANRKVVKVRINRGVVEGREERIALFNELAEVTNSTLVDQRGNAGLFWKP